MKKCIYFFLLFLFINAKTYAKLFQEKFFNVDKLEIYYINNNNPELTDVKYFEGKIIIQQNNTEVKCISAKTGNEYLKFQNLNNGNYQISVAFNETCIGNFDITTLNKNVFSITLKDKDVILKYYLTQLFTDDEIYTKRTSGSGIFINKGTILTNFHVVENFQKITIAFQDKVIPGKVIKFDDKLDIALIEIDSNSITNSQRLSFANYDIAIGKPVYACGFPLLTTMGKELKITSGIISSLTGFNDDNKYLQTTAPIDPGNSGGPLIDENGNIIGIVSAKHSAGTNVGYALKIKFLIKENFIPKATTNKSAMSVQQIYNKSKNTLCIIKCYSL